jgi:competence protein ComEA
MHSPIPTSLSHRLQLTPAWRLVLLLGAPVILAVAVLAAVLLYPGLRPGAAGPGAAAAAPAALTPADAAAAADGAATAALPPAGGLLVEVTGAVLNPGLYRVNKGDRVSAAIAAAGGLSPNADPGRLPNMAARLKDGSQVKVPALGSAAVPRSTTAGAAPRAAAVSLNEASADQLAAVPGFTPDLASAVIRYRTEYGGFSTTRELVDVLNMSEADYLLARKYLRV